MGIGIRSVQVTGIELRTVDDRNDFILRLSSFGITDEDSVFELEAYIEDSNCVVVPIGNMVAPIYGDNYCWVIALDGDLDKYTDFIKSIGYSEISIKSIKGNRIG